MNLKTATKGLKVGFATLLALLFLSPHIGYAAENWDIQSFSTDIVINQDASILVTEKIVVDYSREQHHGIFRLIPFNYEDEKGVKSSIAMNIVSVTNEDGRPWNYEVTEEGNYYNIKIGDADRYLKKVATFTIRYQAWGAIGYFEDHDELYWNSTGDKWGVPIKKAEATILLTSTQDKKTLQTKCFTGKSGSKNQNCTSTLINGKTFQYATTKALNAEEGLTIVAGFPKGTVSATPAMPPENVRNDYGFIQPAKPLTTADLISQNWGFGLPILATLILFILWYTKGRDPQASRTTIMPIYTPPDNLTPTEIGALMDESVEMRDITSAIIDLAIRGYITIVELKEKVLLWNSTDYEFQKVKEYAIDRKLKAHEKAILDALFQSGGSSIKLSKLENKFYQNIPTIKATIYKSLVEDGYFPTSPEAIRKGFMTIGFLLTIIGFISLQFWAVSGSLALPIGIALSSLPFFIFGYYMPAKTSKGVETKYKVLGLKEYINTAEKDRLKFQEKENIFEKLLPYAMTLGIAHKWTKTFEGIYKTPPSWYHSNDPTFMNHFSAMYFIDRLDNISSRMNTTFTSSPSSRSGGSGFSGGGFSGGGGGGGGGGSW